jgi:hypothetical protein
MDKLVTSKNCVESDPLPSGKYYLGDPCYVLSEKQSAEWIEKTVVPDPKPDCPEHKSCLDGVVGVTGGEFFVAATNYGDGLYCNTPDGADIPVDNGCIGLIPIGMLDEVVLKDVVNRQLGTIVELDEGTVIISDNGDIRTIGCNAVDIITAYELSTDDYIDEEYYDDDDEFDNDYEDDWIEGYIGQKDVNRIIVSSK